MKASQLARRLEGMSDLIYREMVKVERLAERISNLCDKCGDVDVPDVEDRVYRTREVAKASGAIGKAGTIIGGIEELLQEAVDLLDDGRVFLEAVDP